MDGAQIIDNQADHFNHHGYDMKGVASGLVRDNLAHDATEANGIYLEYSSGALIEQNTIYNLSASVSGRGSGIQIDVGGTGASIYNNSIDIVRTGIYLINPPAARRRTEQHRAQWVERRARITGWRDG